MAHPFASTNQLVLILLLSVCVVSCAAFAGHIGISMGVTNPARRRSPRKASVTSLSDSPAKKKSPTRNKKTPAKGNKKSPAKKTSKKAVKDPETKIFASDLARIAPDNEWVDLNVATDELRPSNCLIVIFLAQYVSDTSPPDSNIIFSQLPRTSHPETQTCQVDKEM